MNASLITGLVEPVGIAISGNNLFVVNAGTSIVGEYTTSGSTINASLIKGFGGETAIAASGSSLYITNNRLNELEQFSTSGTFLNHISVISPWGIAVIPEPSTWTLLAMGAGALLLGRRRRWWAGPSARGSR